MEWVTPSDKDSLISTDILTMQHSGQFLLSVRYSHRRKRIFRILRYVQWSVFITPHPCSNAVACNNLDEESASSNPCIPDGHGRTLKVISSSDSSCIPITVSSTACIFPVQATVAIILWILSGTCQGWTESNCNCQPTGNGLDDLFYIHHRVRAL